MVLAMRINKVGDITRYKSGIMGVKTKCPYCKKVNTTYIDREKNIGMHVCKHYDGQVKDSTHFIKRPGVKRMSKAEIDTSTLF